MIDRAFLPAVQYVRMSSGKQEESPEQQRAEIKKLAARLGCTVIREYFDEAISGAETRKRKDFMRMIADAERGEFEAILCWDQDRFGRFDSIEAGEFIAPLRRANVRLITVAQGEINWNEFAGRMIYSIQQEGKAQFLVDLSRNCTRGRVASAKRGQVMGHRPLGYDRAYFDERGEFKMRLAYGTKFAKPTNWSSKLVPSENTEQVEIVRWLFRTFAESDRSPGSLSLELNDRGVLSPTGQKWNRSTIRQMLANRSYLGELVYGRHARGKFHRIDGDAEIAKAADVKRMQEGRGPIVYENAHEPLIDRETFDRVQHKLELRGRHRPRRMARSYLLTGLLVCGHCGRRLAGTGRGCTAHTRKDRAASHPGHYRCKSEHDGYGDCDNYGVNAGLLDRLTLNVVTDVLLSPAALERLREELTRQSREHEAQLDTKADERRLRELDTRIGRASRNLLGADADEVQEAREILRQWKRERQALEKALVRKRAIVREPNEIVQRAVKAAETLPPLLAGGDTPRMREALGSLIREIRLWWYPRDVSRAWFRLSHGVVTFCDGHTLEFGIDELNSGRTEHTSISGTPTMPHASKHQPGTCHGASTQPSQARSGRNRLWRW